jgi:hypothetical protein
MGSRPTAEPRDAFQRFAALRPYVRSGEDYLLVQEMIERDHKVRSQVDFDALLAKAGSRLMRERKRRLYQAREHLLATEPDYWLSLNTPYPHLTDIVPRLDPASVYILSTKRASLVARILASWSVAFPMDHIREPGDAAKLLVIQGLLRSGGARRAVFVDDQVDHFAGSRSFDPPIDCRLASWGYIRPPWLTGSPDYRVLDPEPARRLLRPWMRADQAPG